MSVERYAGSYPGPGSKVPLLDMWPHNVELIKTGRKRTTYRQHPLKNGWYKLRGTEVLVFMIQRPPQPINFPSLPTPVQTALADEEGYDTVQQFFAANSKVRGIGDFKSGKKNYYRHQIIEVRKG